MAKRDYYEVLGVSKSASADEIKKSYRRLAKRYHPDSTGGDKTKESRFKDVSNAYDVLGDKNRRAEYDAMRAGPQFPPGFGGFGGGAPGAGGGFGMNLGDLFSQMFSGGVPGGMPGGAPGGSNVRYTYSTDPRAPGRQRRGNGRTARPHAPERRIVRASDGTRLEQRGSDIHSDIRVTIDEAILGCVASVSTLSGTAKVKIPPGTSSGSKLRLKAKGAVGPDGNRGNHYVNVQIDVPTDLDDEAKKLLAKFMKRTRKRS